MLLALAGVALMVGAPGSGSLLGLGAAFVMAIAFSAAIVITRHRRDVSMAPAVCLSQVMLVLAFGPFADAASVTERDLGLLVLLGCGQIALGLVLFTIGARLLPATEVALISLLEIVLGPLWVWIFLSEQPPALSLVGGGVIVLAVPAPRHPERAVPRAQPAARNRLIVSLTPSSSDGRGSGPSVRSSSFASSSAGNGSGVSSQVIRPESGAAASIAATTSAIEARRRGSSQPRLPAASQRHARRRGRRPARSRTGRRRRRGSRSPRRGGRQPSPRRADVMPWSRPRP